MDHSLDLTRATTVRKKISKACHFLKVPLRGIVKMRSKIDQLNKFGLIGKNWRKKPGHESDNVTRLELVKKVSLNRAVE
jgi:hypothetical protein